MIGLPTNDSTTERGALYATVIVVSLLMISIGLVGGVSATEHDTEPAEFNVDIDTPLEVTAGEQFPVTGTVTNVGDESGTAEVTLTVDGETVTTESFELNGGESTLLTEDITAGEAGTTHELEFASQDDTATASVTVVASEESADDGAESTNDDSDLGVAVALVALVSIALLAARKSS